MTFNTKLPLSVFVFLWVNDTGAYCVGSLLGRHKLFPRVSPGKSWEGSIGGAFFVLLAAWGIGWLDNMQVCDLDHQSPIFRGLLTIPEWAGLGLIVVVFGTWGDLVESLFKRTLGIKDSGSILPGHGGMLDRFDSSLLAIPAAVVYLYTLTLLAISYYLLAVSLVPFRKLYHQLGCTVGGFAVAKVAMHLFVVVKHLLAPFSTGQYFFQFTANVLN